MRAMESKQRQCIFGYAKQLGLDNDLLHEHVYQITKKESLKKLSFSEAEDVIKSLKSFAKPNTETTVKKDCWSLYAFGLSHYRPGMATPGQLEFIRAMMFEIRKRKPGNASLDNRLRGWLRKYGKIDDIGFLDFRNARNIIDGMKSYLKRLGWEYKGDRIQELEKEVQDLQEKMVKAGAAEWAELHERLNQVKRELDVLRIHRG